MNVADPKDIESFQKFIFTWWESNKRDLPWRHTHDPYKILVSELMLQQTQVTRVLPKYEEFLSLFPDVHSLASASVGSVLIAWKGMGYNRRALYLKKLSEIIVTSYDGIFPQKEKLLLQLPGIGPYSARAVLVFAFKHDVAMVDTNIRQIIVHHFFNDVMPKESEIQAVADALVPVGKSWEWHQALMDYGSLEIRPKVEIRKRVRVVKDGSVPQSRLPFEQTNRYFRGRIIDVLREKSCEEIELVSSLSTKYAKSREFVNGILDGLVSDGLIERGKNGIISLPE